MAVKIPTELQIMELADEMGLDLTNEDIESYINLLTPNVEAYNIIDARERASVGGYAAIHHACLGGNKDCSKLLIDYGADVNIVSNNDMGETPLHICCKHGHIECAKLLCASDDINVDARDGMGHNVSFWAYSKRYEDMIRILNLPPVKSATAEEYLNIMMARNHNAFTLPSLKKGGKKKKGGGGGKKKKKK